MQSRWTLTALCLLLPLGACDRSTAPLPEPAMGPPATAQASVPDPSLPSADSVFSSKDEAPKADAAAGRSNAPMSAKQESGSMPMPGQNNDHSAPVTPPKPASSPASSPPTL